MPLVLAALTLAAESKGREAVGVQLLGLLRRDDANLVVLSAVLPPGVVDWVDVQPRGGWLSTLLTEALNQLFL